MRVERFDYVNQGLWSPKGVASGGLLVDAYVAREGILEYLRADGSTQRELRLGATHNDKFLNSLIGISVTDGHPPTMLRGSGRELHYKKGEVHEVGRLDGPFVRAPLVIRDAALIAAMRAGRNQISLGYSCELEERKGTHPIYGNYDAIQTTLTLDHVAVVDRGRAGADVRARMDSSNVSGVVMNAGFATTVIMAPQPSNARIDMRNEDAARERQRAHNEGRARHHNEVRMPTARVDMNDEDAARARQRAHNAARAQHDTVRTYARPVVQLPSRRVDVNDEDAARERQRRDAVDRSQAWRRGI